MKRVAIYRRVSKVTDTNLAGSMNDQIDACRARIARESAWLETPGALYSEEGRSAYNENPRRRPEFQRLKNDAKAGAFDVVLVYKFDRFSRKMRFFLNEIADFHDYGVEVLSATEPVDYSTAFGRYSVRSMANNAELFSDMLGERIKIRRMAEAATGRHLGPVPVGYRTEGKGRLVRLWPYDALVYQACTLYAPGQLSPGKIANTLNDMGYTMPNGRPLIATDVRRMMENAQIYAGYVQAAGVWIPGNHEAIIDADLLSRVLSTFERRGVAQDRRFVRTNEPTALLAGLVYCAECEAKMHYTIDKRKDPPWRAYRCKTKEDGGGCEARYAIAEPIEAQVLDLLGALSLALDGNWIEEALSIAESQLSAPAKQERTIDPAKIQEKIRRLGRLYADGIKTDAEYQAELADLRAQLQEVPQRPPPRPLLTLRDVAERLHDIPTLLSAATVGERRAVLNECIDQLYARRDTVTAIRPTGLFEPLLMATRSIVTESGR